MTADQAKYIAQGVVARLKPVCEEIKVCGSLRRLKQEVSDIDLVIIPRRDPVKDMFGIVTGQRVIPEFIQVINSWEKLKGEATGRYTQRLVEGVKVEISIATPENWGNLVMIRTGPSEFSHMMMKAVLKRGFQQKDGYLFDGDRLIPVRQEIDYFKILDLPYVEPKDRTEDVYRKMKKNDL